MHEFPRGTWLAQHPPFHVHYTPTYSSWLNQVERWFGLITQRAIHRGSFRIVKELMTNIDAYSTTTDPASPFSGPLPSILSCRRSHDFAHIFPGQHTSSNGKKAFGRRRDAVLGAGTSAPVVVKLSAFLG